ncbi:DNA gyrase subunit A [Maridesulfovibrio ferrireducens]|uniref:DNA gyrase subunit A n=1 Tax=Maridesulfovibrio ferrireducens TaxID=246191 RepID=UPI001A2DF69F|nr:DNA gyrase subunit A [Maridesulfovibrio ferrireducens]MBI9111156.1 DNA gyrase subunit A [Maridesulfovibrio ferrireducens]
MDQITIEEELKKSYLEYSLSVIIGRAIPDVRDGLKPVHRRILYAMHELGNSYNRAYKKSARIVGDVIGKYHPHGDSAVYDALVRMAQGFSMRDPLVDGQGNFGSIDGDAAAAMRYTESRMSKLSSEFLADLEKNTVDFRDNYDNSLQEPTVLPTKVPNLLLNGTTGIAVGMATNIPPHNLGELLDGTLHLLDAPECSIDDLMRFIKGPDFPTSGLCFGGKGLEEAYKTGRGSIKIRGVLGVEELKNGRQSIVITEIPYALNKSTLVEKIALLIGEGRIEGVSDLRDESDRKGIRIVIDLKRGSIADIIINSLYKFTQLETSFGINMMAVSGNRPMLMNLKNILSFFLEHRREVIIRRTRFDLDKCEKRAHILEGLKIALDNIDEVVKIIRASSNGDEARIGLIDRFEFSRVQAQAILDMRLQRLTNLEHEKILEEYAEILKKIEYFKSILENEDVLKSVIREELTDIRASYSTDRKTVLMDQNPDDIDIEDLIPDDDAVITLSRRGYIKRTPLSNYQQQKRGGKGIAGVQTKDGDFIHTFLTTSNHQFLVLFTTKGKMFKIKVHQVPESSRIARGAHIANLLPLEKDEAIATALTMREFEEDRFFLFVTKKGMVKRSSIALYRNCRQSGIRAVSMREDDQLITVKEVYADSEAILVTKNGTSIRFSCQDARAMGRVASGVKGIALRPKDEVVSGVVTGDEERTQLLTISEGGYGKRTNIEQHRLQTRGGKGIISMRVTTKTGKVLGSIMVSTDDEVVILTSANKIIRLGVKDVSLVGRATQGVRLVRMDENNHAVGFDLVMDDGVEALVDEEETES